MLFFALCAFLTAAAADPATIAARAARAYDAREWASADALYKLLSDAQPTNTEAYARSIVAGIMRGDTVAEVPIIETALKAKVPFDSLMNVVEKNTTNLGRSDDYLALLHRVEQRLPYLRRPTYRLLLNYYQFRRNPEMCIVYCRLLLTGMPDDTARLNELANAQAMAGELNDAEATWRRIIELDPDNFDALVGLGNALLPRDRGAGVELLRRACQLCPTPYLEAICKDGKQ